MLEHNTGILQAVAAPRTFLFAPFELAIVNIILAVVFMLICVAVLGWTPFVAMIPLAIGHVALVGAGLRDQHLTTILQARGKYAQPRKNLAPVSCGTKFSP